MDESQAHRNDSVKHSALDEINIAENSNDPTPDPELNSGPDLERLDFNTLPSPASGGSTLDAIDWRGEVSERVEKFRKKRARQKLASESGNLGFDFDIAPPRDQPQDSDPVDKLAALELDEGIHLNPSEILPVLPALRNDTKLAANEPMAVVAPEASPRLNRQDHANALRDAAVSRIAGARRKLQVVDRQQRGPTRVEHRPDENELARRSFPRLADPWLTSNQGRELLEPEPLDEQALGVAPVSPRFLAGLVDLGVLILCGAVFEAIFWEAGGHVARHPVTLLCLGFVGLIFCTAYFGLFTALSGSTPGLSALGMRLSRSDGGAPTASEALMRAAGYVVSAGALMMGFVWAAVDGDGLTWHDRMSDTFVTQAPLPPPEEDRRQAEPGESEGWEMSL